MGFEICDRIIGDGQRCFLISEIGANHNGDIENAYKLIDLSKKAGFDAVKFQCFKAEEVYLSDAKFDETYNGKNVFKIVKDAEAPFEWFKDLYEYTKNLDLCFIATPVGNESLRNLIKSGVDALKLASFNLQNVPLLKKIAITGKPLILSTGLSSFCDIELALDVVKSLGNKDIALLHCISTYPADLKDMNLNFIKTLTMVFEEPVGLSDHSMDPVIVPTLAAILGASIIEKHVTLDKNMPGPDHHFAIEPDEMNDLVKEVRRVEKMDDEEKAKRLNENMIILGGGRRKLSEKEKIMRRYTELSLFAIKRITKGEKISENNTRVLRVAQKTPGIAPKYFDLILGKRVRMEIRPGEPLRWDHFMED